MDNLVGKYFVKFTQNGDFIDITSASLADGVRILAINGFFEQGEPVNVYTAQWVDSQTEDMMIAKRDNSNNPVVVRKNVDIEITFIVKKKYASNQSNFNVAARHDYFIELMTSSELWIKSLYANKIAHCICLKEYKPTTVKLQRGDDSFIMGTLTLHLLDKATNIS